MDDLRIIYKLEKGQQLGKIYTFKKGIEAVWSSVAIQKYMGFYVVYIDEVLESKMGLEEYEKEVFMKFNNLKDAVLFIEGNSQLRFVDLGILKGQKIFNPSLA